MNGESLKGSREYSLTIHNMSNPMDPDGMKFKFISYHNEDIYLN